MKLLPSILLVAVCFSVHPRQSSCFTPIVSPKCCNNNILESPSLTSSSLGSTKKSSTDDAQATLVTENPRKVGLALQLDDGTRKSHSVAENTAFVTGFFKGLSTRESYKILLTSLYFVYKAMEEAFDDADEDLVQKLDYSALRRLDSLTQDMEFFYGPNWQGTVQPSKAAQKYVDRIKNVANGNEPRLLIAHQYTRYLGDLFGGQMMGSMASKSLDLETGKGTAFYTFDKIDDKTEFITEWYTKLNELDLSDQEKEDIVDEANLAFALNIEVFEELEGSAVKAIWTLLWETFREKMGLV
jgi:heme oxygenase